MSLRSNQPTLKWRDYPGLSGWTQEDGEMRLLVVAGGFAAPTSGIEREDSPCVRGDSRPGSRELGSTTGMTLEAAFPQVFSKKHISTDSLILAH